MSDGSRIDAASLIVADLQDEQRNRRRHFLPALLIVVCFVGGGLMLGMRPDLLEQPWWQLALQCVLWLLCLLVFPAIGLGLIFPNRPARIGIALGAFGLTLLATLGLPHEHGGFFGPDEHFDSGCGAMIVVCAAVVLLMGIVSGAFVQRRKSTAVYWISAGISLTALTAITWHCPLSGAAHVIPSHLAVVAGVMVFTSLVGTLMHRRHRQPN